MPHDQYNRLLAMARTVFPRPTFTLVGAGLAHGDTNWPRDSDRTSIDILDVHPYAKEPGHSHPDLNPEPMLGRYEEYGVKLWCTEYDSRVTEMNRYLKEPVERAAVMCWTDDQTVNRRGIELGIRHNETRWTGFVEASGGVPWSRFIADFGP